MKPHLVSDALKVQTPKGRLSRNHLTNLDVPIRGAQFETDRITPIRICSDLRSHDSKRNPKFRSIRCDVFTLFFKCLGFFSNRAIRFARFGSLADPDSNRAHRDI